MAGGPLQRDGDSLNLLFPLLTPPVSFLDHLIQTPFISGGDQAQKGQGWWPQVPKQPGGRVGFDPRAPSSWPTSRSVNCPVLTPLPPSLPGPQRFLSGDSSFRAAQPRRPQPPFWPCLSSGQEQGAFCHTQAQPMRCLCTRVGLRHDVHSQLESVSTAT